MSSKAVRLDNSLIRAAEAEAKMMHRSLPKQLEYWASIGRDLSKVLNPEDILKVSLGLADLQLKAKAAAPVSAEQVLQRLAALQASGELSRRVTGARVVYEAADKPGLLVRIQDGVRQLGRFSGGRFVPVEAHA